MEEKKKTPGKRNKAAGHGYELRVVKTFQKMFPHVRTSRSVSRFRDNQKVDLAHTDEYLHGRFPYNIQCKNVKGAVTYPKILKSMPKDAGIPNVIFHKYTVKKDFKTGGSNFTTVGEYAICDVVDFLKLVQYREAYRILYGAYEHLPTEIQQDIQQKFIERGLA